MAKVVLTPVRSGGLSEFGSEPSESEPGSVRRERRIRFSPAFSSSSFLFAFATPCIFAASVSSKCGFGLLDETRRNLVGPTDMHVYERTFRSNWLCNT
ncbi:hypothetical protein BDN72DRAFT_579598 [Pluteus cervinus]|uniref:Uncharacterized protein n=1 Tax=Pluteus cervinus TaxID=181527 RepID=A0ACD3AVZ0_9AGAR|nr:hypothetical protein BDN72DRAFT_579598 [Pluteus cervinus]